MPDVLVGFLYKVHAYQRIPNVFHNLYPIKLLSKQNFMHIYERADKMFNVAWHFNPFPPRLAKTTPIVRCG